MFFTYIVHTLLKLVNGSECFGETQQIYFAIIIAYRQVFLIPVSDGREPLLADTKYAHRWVYTQHKVIHLQRTHGIYGEEYRASGLAPAAATYISIRFTEKFYRFFSIILCSCYVARNDNNINLKTASIKVTLEKFNTDK